MNILYNIGELLMTELEGVSVSYPANVDNPQQLYLTMNDGRAYVLSIAPIEH